MNQPRISVIGLGYVGLPLALAFSRTFDRVIGFDCDTRRVDELRKGLDRTGESREGELSASSLRITSDPEDLRACDFHVVAVPTPIDRWRKPDLGPVVSASDTVGAILKPGDLVVYESTVYPGVTEEVCGPILERRSGLVRGRDFTLGYSPERINPGDREHTLETIVKVVSAEDPESLERVASVYASVAKAGVHRASSIKVAEAAKVIENTQRDLNIALMNELALIFDRMGIPTRDVLSAAGTKWNFLPFTPGLVGGHCIGVDPYYLTTKAQELGYHPEVILAGRRINDGMGAFIAQRTVKLLIQAGRPVKGSRVGILGLTFKENIPDIRNSKVPDIVAEFREFGVEALVHDPHADHDEVKEEYGLELQPLGALVDLDALVLAVSHSAFLQELAAGFLDRLPAGAVVVDVKAMLDAASIPAGLHYWCL